MATPEPLPLEDSVPKTFSSLESSQVPHTPSSSSIGTDSQANHEKFKTYASLSVWASKRSKDPELQVGCCLVVPNSHVEKLRRTFKIVGFGYNGFPKTFADSETRWKGKHNYVVHAEANSILFANTTQLEDGVAFATLFPCHDCAKLLIQVGVKHVFYNEFKYRAWSYYSPELLLRHGVTFSPYLPSSPDLTQHYKMQVEHNIHVWDPKEEEKKNKGHFSLEDLIGSNRFPELKKLISPLYQKKDKEGQQEPLSPTSWDEYFMGLAILAAEKSDCNKRGCCIAASPEQPGGMKILGIGYDGVPLRDSGSPIIDQLEKYLKNVAPKTPKEEIELTEDDLRFPPTQMPNSIEQISAEINAILFANTIDLRDAMVFCTHNPDPFSTRILLQKGIKLIVYNLLENTDHLLFAQSLCQSTNATICVLRTNGYLEMNTKVVKREVERNGEELPLKDSRVGWFERPNHRLVRNPSEKIFTTPGSTPRRRSQEPRGGNESPTRLRQTETLSQETGGSGVSRVTFN